MKAKLMNAASSKLPLLAAVGAAMVVASQKAQAVFTPVSVDPADAISQVNASAGDLLPFALVMAGAGIVFKMVRRFIR